MSEPTTDIEAEIARLQTLAEVQRTHPDPFCRGAAGDHLSAGLRELFPVLLAERALLVVVLARLTADTTSSKPYRQRYRETSRELVRANHHLAAALGRVKLLQAEQSRARELEGELP